VVPKRGAKNRENPPVHVQRAVLYSELRKVNLYENRGDEKQRERNCSIKEGAKLKMVISRSSMPPRKRLRCGGARSPGYPYKGKKNCPLSGEVPPVPLGSKGCTSKDSPREVLDIVLRRRGRRGRGE